MDTNVSFTATASNGHTPTSANLSEDSPPEASPQAAKESIATLATQAQRLADELAAIASRAVKLAPPIEKPAEPPGEQTAGVSPATVRSFRFDEFLANPPPIRAYQVLDGEGDPCSPVFAGNKSAFAVLRGTVKMLLDKGGWENCRVVEADEPSTDEPSESDAWGAWGNEDLDAFGVAVFDPEDHSDIDLAFTTHELFDADRFVAAWVAGGDGRAAIVIHAEEGGERDFMRPSKALLDEAAQEFAELKKKFAPAIADAMDDGEEEDDEEDATPWMLPLDVIGNPRKGPQRITAWTNPGKDWDDHAVFLLDPNNPERVELAYTTSSPTDCETWIGAFAAKGDGRIPASVTTKTIRCFVVPSLDKAREEFERIKAEVIAPAVGDELPEESPSVEDEENDPKEKANFQGFRVLSYACLPQAGDVLWLTGDGIRPASAADGKDSIRVRVKSVRDLLADPLSCEEFTAHPDYCYQRFQIEGENAETGQPCLAWIPGPTPNELDADGFRLSHVDERECGLFDPLTDDHRVREFSKYIEGRRMILDELACDDELSVHVLSEGDEKFIHKE